MMKFYKRLTKETLLTTEDYIVCSFCTIFFTKHDGCLVWGSVPTNPKHFLYYNNQSIIQISFKELRKNIGIPGLFKVLYYNLDVWYLIKKFYRFVLRKDVKIPFEEGDSFTTLNYYPPSRETPIIQNDSAVQIKKASGGTNGAV